MRILFAAAAILLTICTDALGQVYRRISRRPPQRPARLSWLSVFRTACADRNAAKDESRGSSAAPAGRGCQCRAGARCRRQMTGGAVSFRAARQFAEITASE